MNIWKILKISPTRDVKEIKRAYARELKVTRPDENPDAFQTLYDAYQSALNYAAHQKEDTSDEFVDEFLDQTQHINPDVIEENNEPTDSQIELAEEKENQLRMVEYERIIAEVKRLLEIHEVGPNLQPWYFITQCPYIFEDRFNWFLGKEIFKLFTDYQKQKYRSRKHYQFRRVRRGLLDFCDYTFSWKNNAYYLQAELGEDICRQILTSLDDPFEDKENMGLRGGTLVIAANKPIPQEKTTETKENAVGCVTIIQVLFFIVAIMNLIKLGFEK